MSDDTDFIDEINGDAVDGGDKIEVPAVYEKLKAIRARKDIEGRKPDFLAETIRAMDGREIPLRLRYYQVQGVLHMLAMPRFLLGDDTGLGKCKGHASLILTGQGLSRLGDLVTWQTMSPDTFAPLREPTTVWTGWEWAPVKQFYYGGVKPVRRIRTRRGYEVDGTLVHPLWCRGADGSENFVQTRDLREGDFLAIERKPVEFPETDPELPVPDVSKFDGNTKLYNLPTRLTPDLAAFLAYVVAEGNVTRHAVCVTQDRNINPECHDHIRDVAFRLFGWDGNVGATTRDTCVSICSTHIRSYLVGLGVSENLSADKVVPWPIFRGTRETVAAYLRAFFDSEGSVYAGAVEVSSASERMLREVQILLLRFGITSTRQSKRVKGYDHTYWRLTLCGDDMREFERHIGFITPRKRDELRIAAEKPSNANLDVVPHARGLVDALRRDISSACTVRGSNGSRLGSGLKQFGVSFEKTLNNIRNTGRNPTYAFLRKLLDVAREVSADGGHAYAAVADVVHNHFFYDSIDSITEGEEPVMDIEVDHPRHSFVGDGFVNHNTLQTIGSLCFLWEKAPTLKVIVITSKSAVTQWGDEFSRFTRSGTVQVHLAMGTPKQREKIRREFEESVGASVLVMGYRTAVQDFTALCDMAEGYALVLDEASAFKNHQTQVHQAIAHLSSRASRVWGLTATLIKNNLVEGWGIYRVIVPGLFGSHNAFLRDFCVTRMQALPGQRGPRARQVPVIVGYRAKDIAAFRERIDPYFLGRPKFEVASELPPLVSRTIKVGLTKFQREKYEEALSGLLLVGETTGNPDEREVTKLTAVTYCQQIVNSPGLIGCDGDSAKVEALLDLLDGDLDGEKVIVFSRYSKMIDILMPELERRGHKPVRITGEENQKQRKASQDAFQSADSGCRVVCITTAAEEAINLQAAIALIFFDTPWSGGSYIQILGRMIRLGSLHDRCYAIHLVAEKTIDERVMKILSSKMGLIESVIGKRIKGEGDDDILVSSENDLSDLFNSLVSDAKNSPAKS